MTNNAIKLSPHFTLAELTRSSVALARGIDNAPGATEIANLKLVCIRILEPVRNHYNIAFTPNSGYRSYELNQAVRGSKTSQHMHGQAVDFEVPGVSNYDLALWVSENLIYDQLILENYTQGIPNSGWVHCSITATENRMQCLTINGAKKQNGLCK